jgi:hypothetical protein
MQFQLTFHGGDQWLLIDETGGEVMCRPFRIDITSLLWRALSRKHIGDVTIHGTHGGRTITRKLFDAHHDYSEVADLSFTFGSHRDRVTLAGFLWVLSDPNYRQQFDGVPIPKAKRPTSKKAVKNDWEYNTPIAASA